MRVVRRVTSYNSQNRGHCLCRAEVRVRVRVRGHCLCRAEVRELALQVQGASATVSEPAIQLSYSYGHGHSSGHSYSYTVAR